MDQINHDFGRIDYVVHSIANGPEVKKTLLDTSRSGYLAAQSASAYSLVSMVSRFAPILNPGMYQYTHRTVCMCDDFIFIAYCLSLSSLNAGGAVLSLSYIAGERVIPGYGGGMSSAKAALESDTRTLAFETGTVTAKYTCIL